MSNLIPFNYNQKQVRVIEKDGQPWFVGKDVIDILDINNITDAMSRLDEDELDSIELIDSIGRNQKFSIVSEPGLYSLVLGSRKSEAKIFKRWITHEVIPSIRKTGVYAVPTVDSTMMFQIAQAMAEKEKQIALMKPKADFFDSVADSKDAIDIGQAAKVLNFGKGRTTLFKILRQEKVLMDNNQPYQRFIDSGYFRTIEQKFTKPDGSTCINIKTLVYQKGLQYIKKVLDREAV